jgi:hypothetical protein
MIEEAKIERFRLRKVGNVERYVKYNQQLQILEIAVYKEKSKTF